MKSPFPGMDPYLERHWLDVQTMLVAYAVDELNRLLPETLAARAEERRAVEPDWDDPRCSGPDAGDLEPPTDAGTSVEGPIRLVAGVEPVVERFIKVIEARTERVIAVIEFVSRANKIGNGLREFRSKRAKQVASGVNFVEIDLLRTGDWQRLLAPHWCPSRYVTTYRATIRVPHDAPAVYLYPVPLRAPLPEIKVPLRRDDRVVTLALQPLVDRAYDNGRYARRLDYSRPCDPPLTGEDAAWAEQLLRATDRGGTEPPGVQG